MTGSNVYPNFSRQRNFFDKNAHIDQEIHIIGCGAIGSNTAMLIAKHGLYRNVHVWDYDIVQDHNISNQSFEIDSHLGVKKVDAIADHIMKTTHYKINTHDVKIEPKSQMKITNENNPALIKGIVFLALDSFSARKMIYEEYILNNLGVELVFDGRTALRFFDMYMFNPHDTKCEKEWFRTIGKDEQVTDDACHVPEALGALSYILSGIMVVHMLEWLNAKKQAKIYRGAFFTRYSPLNIHMDMRPGKEK